MRDGLTYRSARRNVFRRGPKGRVVRRLEKESQKLSGENHKRDFDAATVKYNPPETSGYWPNREDLKHAGKLG